MASSVSLFHARAATNKEDSIIGRHVFGNLYGVDPEKLKDKELIENIVITAARESSATILEVKSWLIQGYHGGVSVIALIIESHIAIHTWPDYGYATVDVYTCGSQADPLKAFKIILDNLKPRRYVAFYVDRSSNSEPDTLHVRRITL